MKIAYFDCFSGISGDMCLGALVDAGVPLKELESHLKRLPVKGYSLSEEKVRRAGIAATKVDVILKPAGRGRQETARKLVDIRRIIEASSLSEDIRKKGAEVFNRLFEAEAGVHGEPINKVHLHELGGIDCLVDIFGTLIGLDLLGIEKIHASPVNLGGGAVETAHGTLPVPAPATTEILRGVPVYSAGPPFELTTPTGAAILKSVAEEFGEMPLFIHEKTGVGAGSKEFEKRPNILRIFTGDMYRSPDREKVTVIETNIDDMNPQIYEYIIEKLFQDGALDVYMTQIIMKKTRPGVKLSVLCHADRRDDLISLILRESTTIGVRYYETSRVTLGRELKNLRTGHGRVRVKISELNDSGRKYTPEYDDCRKIASQKNVPLVEVIEEAKRTACGGKRKKTE